MGKARWLWGALLLLGLMLGAAVGWFYWQARPVSQRFAPQLIRLREPTPAEALAERLCRELLETFPPVQRVELTLRKRLPPAGTVMENAGVRIARER